MPGTRRHSQVASLLIVVAACCPPAGRAFGAEEAACPSARPSAACEDLLVPTPELADRLRLPVAVDLRDRFPTYVAGLE